MERIRIGLIEIGSRSARYLVVDIHGRVQDFQAVKIMTVQHHIDPATVGSADIKKINELVLKLRADLTLHGCDIEYIYGTELCRAMHGVHPGELSPFVRLLSTEEEAKAAWAAALLCQGRDEELERLTVIDLGNGSTEIVRGSWDGTQIKDLKTASVSIGSSLLMNRYNRDKKSYVRFLVEQLPSIRKALQLGGIGRDQGGTLYLVGGVATKIGWLSVRNDVSDVYRPDLVNGVLVSLTDIDELFTRLHVAYLRSPQLVERIVDARRGSESEGVRVISGAAYFAALVRNVHSTTSPRISGYGVRHGIAFLLRYELLNV